MKEGEKLGRADETIADRAAWALKNIIWTLPPAHPLLKDNASRMTRVKEAMDRFRYRKATHGEMMVQQAGEKWAIINLMIPDIPPLEHPATPDDLAAGRAIFTLDGKGERVAMALPARAIFAADAGQTKPRTAIIVQAEKRPDGVVIYGALFRGGWGSMSDRELADVEPLVEPKAVDEDD